MLSFVEPSNCEVPKHINKTPCLQREAKTRGVALLVPSAT